MNNHNKNRVEIFIYSIELLKDYLRNVLLEEQSVLDNLPGEQKEELESMQESIYCLEEALDTCDLTIDYLKGAVK